MMNKFQEVSMKGKVKQTIGGLRKSVRAAGVGFSTLAASFFMLYCFPGNGKNTLNFAENAVIITLGRNSIFVKF